jgi:hypothetical protein
VKSLVGKVVQENSFLIIFVMSFELPLVLDIFCKLLCLLGWFLVGDGKKKRA